MLLKLDYRVKFKATGKQLKGSINFQSGLSGISGPNEAGKSTVLELIRFALWGTKALRAPASSYELIAVELHFVVAGITYRVDRGMSSCQLFKQSLDGWKPQASGTSVVNAKIIAIFGYGMNVFDIAHYCGQGQVEALTAMPGTERKKMIDRVIGMDQLDVAAAAVGDEAKELRTQIKTLEMTLGEAPAEPAVPDNYMPPHFLKAALEEGAKNAKRLTQLQAYIEANATLTPPPAPQIACSSTTQELQDHQRRRAEAVGEQEALRKLIGGAVPTKWTAQQLVEIEQGIEARNDWFDQINFQNRYGERPTETLEELQAADAAWEAYFRRIEAESQLKNALEAGTTCPKCDHTWHKDDAHIAALRAKAEALKDVPEPKTEWAKVKNALGRASAWAGRKVLTVEPPVPALGPGGVQEARRAFALAPIWDRLNALVVPEDRSMDLARRETYDRLMASYGIQMDLYNKTCQELEGYRQERDDLTGADARYEHLLALQPVCISYDTRMEVYEDQKVRFDAAVAKLDAVRSDLEQAVAAGEAVKTLRSKIKAHLVPSLNVAASDLISKMTGGVRSDIAVDENFENILVDGQPVETLSGSAKAVANLAIRLGLGQVLTNKVFSVFLGDEIDASMDADRADYTAECLKGLNSVIKQIILVSHKDLEVQHNIKIG